MNPFYIFMGIVGLIVVVTTIYDFVKDYFGEDR